jgi:16S rRNA (cytosine967-C5)-methyltransferase
MTGTVKQGFPPGRPRPVPCGADGWEAAVALTERWLARRERVDALLEQLAPGLTSRERARAQHLFYGVVRWADRIDAALAGLMARAPRTRVRAVLMVAGFELLESPAETAPVVHHAVERAKGVASAKEAGLVNAVARRLAPRLAARPATLAEAAAHPAWLVTRWERQFGPVATAELLEWNQRPAPVYARWRVGGPTPEFLAATRWAGFFLVQAGHWEEVRRLAQEGALYLQDPSTRLCVELLAPGAGETILDACAAPGGKSLAVADALVASAGPGAAAGRLVALDEPGPRLDRLKENLQRAPAGVEVALMPGDLRRAGPGFFRDCNLPTLFDAVLLDAPCSNTGVMRHRIDVKHRLREDDFARHAAQQLALLRAAAALARPGGRIVYSTCSLENEENEGVVRAFLTGRGGAGWHLDRHVLASPWVDGHDGAGAFLLRRA